MIGARAALFLVGALACTAVPESADTGPPECLATFQEADTVLREVACRYNARCGNEIPENYCLDAFIPTNHPGFCMDGCRVQDCATALATAECNEFKSWQRVPECDDKGNGYWRPDGECSKPLCSAEWDGCNGE